ncbi:MAG: FHA domain-containing protein [Clostridia bacterium]|nr:FHA domain-containing protein [Clostridia bacterium]
MIRFIKKLSSILLLLMIFTLTADAAEEFEVAQIKSKLPYIDVEVVTNETIEPSDVVAELDSISLKTNSVLDCNFQSVTTYVSVLIDISNSISQSDLEAIKQLIKDYSVDFVNTQNQLVVYTFGSELNQLTQIGDSPEQVAQKLDTIEYDYDGTDFFGAISEVHKKSKASTAERQYMIVFSDGYDEAVKGNESYEEITRQISCHDVPVYAMCLESATTHASQIFGDIARSSGGSIVIFDEENAEEKFDGLQQRINSVKRISFTTDSNTPVGKKNLTVRIADKKITAQIEATEYVADGDAPKVTSLLWNNSEQCFEITFSEEVVITDSETNFIIKNHNEKIIGIKQISGEGASWRIYTDDDIYTGTYTIAFSGITDDSFEKNLLSDSQISLEVKGKSPVLKVLGFWWVLVPFVFLGALWGILIHVKKKKNVKTIKEIFETQYEVQYEEEYKERKKEVNVIKAQEPVKMNHITLYVSDGRGTLKKLQIEFYKSIIVGRGQGCEVIIPDNRMSRQHFAIEHGNTVWVLKDLNTTNGTYLNGIRLVQSQVIKSGDKISAGNMTITVEF